MDTITKLVEHAITKGYRERLTAVEKEQANDIMDYILTLLLEGWTLKEIKEGLLKLKQQ